ncbi:glycoside hydrolase family 43 protein [Sphingomonas sp. CJ99]
MRMVLALAAALMASAASAQTTVTTNGNPLFKDRFTADPAPLVVGDTLYLYTGHDQARDGEMFRMEEWIAYSTKDLKTWTYHGPIMRATDFKWAKGDAWASQVHQKNGKFWFYTAVEHDGTHPGKSIGVAVSDSPTGPFVDAKGSALVHNDMTPDGPHHWDDIDPTVWTEPDGTSYLIWGNGNCYMAKLKPNMIELDGPIVDITPRHFEEGPWVHKRGDLYYLTYASMDRASHRDERISYATAPSITGPWTYRGELTDVAKNSFTIHPGVAEFRGDWLFFYHDASLTVNGVPGSMGRRAVRAEKLHHKPDGTLAFVEQTPQGIWK